MAKKYEKLRSIAAIQHAAGSDKYERFYIKTTKRLSKSVQTMLVDTLGFRWKDTGSKHEPYDCEYYIFIERNGKLSHMEIDAYSDRLAKDTFRASGQNYIKITTKILRTAIKEIAKEDAEKEEAINKAAAARIAAITNNPEKRLLKRPKI